MERMTRTRTFTVKAGALAAVLLLAGCLAACAPHAATSGETLADSGDSSESTEAASVEFAWSPDADCTMCHSTEATSMTSATHQIGASHGDVACTTCHTQEEALVTAHEKVEATDTKGAKKLKSTEVPREACLSCHESDYTPEAISEENYLVDDQGTAVNPHDLPESESHATVVCANCHQMHSEDSLLETAATACTNCHHQNVYQCYTCHE